MKALKMTLKFCGPVLTSGLGATRLGLDAEAYRSDSGQRVIAASHVRGQLREALVELLAMAATTEVREAEDFLLRLEAAAGMVFGRPDDRTADGVSSGRRGVVRVEDLRLGAAPGDAAEVGSATLEPWDAKDVVVSIDASASGMQTRVAIDGETGTARRGALAFVETPGYGEVTQYAGVVRVLDPVPPDVGLSADELLDVLGWCAHWMRFVGKNTSSGWGQIAGRALDPDPTKSSLELPALLGKLWSASANAVGSGGATAAPVVDEVAPAASDVRFEVALVLHEPVLVADGHAGANVFEGREDVPGSVLRRAMADVLLREAGQREGGWIDEALAAAFDKAGKPASAALCRRFNAVQVGFALPAAMGLTARPRPLPATAVVVEFTPEELAAWIAAGGDNDGASKGKVAGDALWALAEKPDDLAAAVTTVLEAVAGRASFVLETKVTNVSWSGMSAPRTLRTHVAKNRRTGSAREGHLYSTRPISPVRREGGKAERTVLVAPVSCPAALADEVRRVLAQVRRVGKSTGKGYGRVVVRELPAAGDAQPQTGQAPDWVARLRQWQELRSGGVWNPAGDKPIEVPVLLVTDAALLPVVDIAVATNLKEHYSEAWAEVLADANAGQGLVAGEEVTAELALACHRLWGGATAAGTGALPPTVLTKAGATFLLKFTGVGFERVVELMTPVALRGAQRNSVLEALGQAWCRYVPLRALNGYGEVVIAPTEHTDIPLGWSGQKKEDGQ
jgi:hypothetical protein